MCSMTDERTLLDEEREMIHKVFQTLKTAYDHIGRACGLIGALSKKLNSSQLMTVLKASIRPVIQVNTAALLHTRSHLKSHCPPMSLMTEQNKLDQL